MAEQLVGTWNLESSENWEEYMKELGVGLITRKAAATIKPTVIISNNGTQWTFKMQSTLKNSEQTATEGVEFNETTIDGRESKSLVTRDGAKLIHEQRDPKTNELKTRIVREIVGDNFVQTLTAGSVVCKRIYKRA